MIDIQAVGFTNFLSYGNYETIVDFTKISQCLIAGPNGYGKSALADAILWVFFGRTMRDESAASGDRVVNWHTGKNCRGYVKLKNGDMITRTRKTEGHNELIVERSGDVLLQTLSTTPQQQAQLNKLYNLDWSIFTGSSFFTQYGRPWLEMPDQFRRAAMERIMRLDRMTVYATVGKERVASIESKQTQIRSVHSNIERTISSLQEELQEAQLSEASFEQDRTARYKKIQDQAAEYRRRAAQIAVPDIEELRRVWETIEKIRTKIRDLGTQENQLSVKQATISRQVRELETRIATWHAKSGQMCIECEQEVNSDHTEHKALPLQEQLGKLHEQLSAVMAQRSELASRIRDANDKLASSTPKHTVREAQAIKAQVDGILESARRMDEQANEVAQESNPHGQTIERLGNKLSELQLKLESEAGLLAEFDLLHKHASYIHRAYHDRRKIKSFEIARRLPFFNKRLRYYMDKFGVEMNIELTESLGISSDLWGHRYLCGGERKRADVSFMLATFDLHESLYGRQCNTIVLDEVDGRLDSQGIEALIDVIKTDLASRVDSVLVISHRNQMFDAFPNQIIIQKDGKFSYISEIR